MATLGLDFCGRTVMIEQSQAQQLEYGAATPGTAATMSSGSAVRKIHVIASATYNEVTRQPVYYIIVGVFAVLIFFSPLFALFHFEEKDMVMELGIASLMAAGLFIAIVSAGFSISREMDKMIPFSILCKPVRRSHFLLGKFAGIYLAVLMAVAFLTLVMLLSLDNFRSAGELAVAEPLPPECTTYDALNQYLDSVGARQMLPVLGGALVTAFGLALITAFAVAIAVHLPLVVTGAICVVVFIIGNLASFALRAAEGAPPLGRAAAWACHVILPNMGMFNMTNFVAVDKRVGLSYIVATGLYSLAYSAVILLLGVVLFARKEIK